MDKKLTIVCVLWQGDFRHREYEFDWVVKLRNMAKKNISIAHEFVCLTNIKPMKKESEGIKIIPLINDWPGWWSKIELFRPDIFEGRVLCLDLDMIIIDNIDYFATHPSPFILLGPWGRAGAPIKIKEGKRALTKYNSSVMSFYANGGIPEKMYRDFDYGAINFFRGDQDYIADACPYLDTFKKGMVVKLKDCPGGRLHDTAKIVLCMPDKNNKAAHKYKWVREVWQ